MFEGTLSVLIPTYNRKQTLLKTLEAYMHQTSLQEILEILVVDDGSKDGTGELVKHMGADSPVPVRYLCQPNQGLAAARNHGIREARGSIILFGDDDIIPAPNLVTEHLAWHEKFPEHEVGVMGYVAWSPKIHPTPFMEWLSHAGPQSAYAALRSGRPVHFTQFIVCNASVKLAFLKANGLFDESFRTYGFEDLEMGYRMKQKGMRMLYNPNAVGYHYKRMTFADVCRRAQTLQEARKVFETKEAGICFRESEAKRKSSRNYRLQKLLVRTLVPLLTPLKPLVDSRIPLPWSVYRALYAYYTQPAPALPHARPSE